MLKKMWRGRSVYMLSPYICKTRAHISVKTVPMPTQARPSGLLSLLLVWSNPPSLNSTPWVCVSSNPFFRIFAQSTQGNHKPEGPIRHECKEHGSGLVEMWHSKSRCVWHMLVKTSLQTRGSWWALWLTRKCGTSLFNSFLLLIITIYQSQVY